MYIPGTSGADYLYGTSLDDDIFGFDGSDHLWGYGGTDRIYGGIGNDWLYGGANIDYLYGGADNDYLDGGTEADQLYGGAGNDTYIVENAGDRVYETWGNGYDTIRSYLNSYTIPGDAFVEVLELSGPTALNGSGNGYDNRISGNSNNNTLNGGGGNDNLYGLNGVDTLNGGIGYDYLDGGYGADILIGGLDNDTYVVDDAGDRVYEYFGGGSANVVNSYITYSLEGTYLEHLTLLGSAAIDGTGNEQNNTINGNSAANVLRGGDGDDYIDGKGGADTMHGGIGDDIYYVDHAGDTEVEDPGRGEPEAPGGGFDVVYATVSHTIGANVEVLYLMGTAANGTGNEQDNTIHGNAASNTLTGRGGTDSLSGYGGIDHLYGGAEHDWLYGGTEGDFLYGEGGGDDLDGGEGADTMRGGDGSDWYWRVGAGDDVIEIAGEGDADKVLAVIDYVLDDQVENLELMEEGGAIDGTGNALDNLIAGNSFANTLTGGLGDDIYVTDASDTVVEREGEGTDLVQSSTSFHLGLHPNVENLTLTGLADINGVGNALDNVIIGNSGNNVLVGYDGADTLDGGGGFSDTASYTASDAAVTVNLLTGTGSGGHAQGDVLRDIDSLAGSAFADTLTGDDRDNTLSGSGGADVLIGGLGQDTLMGGEGADHFRFVDTFDSAPGLPDRITDFSTAQGDQIDLRMIDANGISDTDDPFSFIGDAPFTPGVLGEIRYAGGFLEGNIGFGEAADFRIEIGVASLTVDDFLL